MPKQSKFNTLSIQDLQLKNQRVLLRVDFNVPIDAASGKILDDTRIIAAIPTIQKIIQSGGTAILLSHLGRPKDRSKTFSLQPIAQRLSELLKQPVLFLHDSIGPDVKKAISKMHPGDVALLENVRFYPAEENPEVDKNFAKNLAELADCYVDDAFGAAHRAHSSIVEVAKYFPGKAASGYLLEKEMAFLGQILDQPAHPFYAIIAGAKVSTKLGILKKIIVKMDGIFIAGGMAFTFLKAKGIPVGDSPIEESMLDEAKAFLIECEKKKIPLFLPEDIVAATQFDNNASYKTFSIQNSPGGIGIPTGYQGMDIGKKTVEIWRKELQSAKLIFWNGPVGVFEMDNFDKGTIAIAQILAEMKGRAITIAGGGETCAAIQKAGLTSHFSHISTGGGACLEYIEHSTLPGIDALSKQP